VKALLAAMAMAHRSVVVVDSSVSIATAME
jgi:hypothetical protein